MVWVADPFYWRRAGWRGVTDPNEGRCHSVEFLLRTDALVAALSACGGFAKWLGKLIRLFPRRLRNAGYHLVARLRHRSAEW